ncbi:MAG: exodeoxyribonuclease VII large subunit [Porphyromonadaceae bacterium]|nr:exodeoxyribonuclease VII large subunit [Porphyromonadaceae bacterium]
MPTLFDQRPPQMTLSRLTTLVGNALRVRPELQNVWVVAEFSDLRTAGGHCYVNLIEKNQAGTTVARMNANIWGGTYAQLRAKFHAATGSQLASGMKVLLYGAVTHHNLYGIAFNIRDIDPSYTLGDMERLRREILAQLQREGLLDRNKGTYLAPNPQKIAVISAEGAAGYGDFCNQLASNPGGFKFYPHLFPAILQGERTVPTVMAQLAAISETIDFWDCVVIIRGGGATSDLNSFDNLDLARAVATFPLPVIVGIGHERDNTVLDYIAHTRCKTPTAVAEFLVERLRQSSLYANTLGNNIIRYVQERMTGEQRRLDSASAMIRTLAESRLTRAADRLDALRRSTAIVGRQRIALHRERLEGIIPRLRQAADNALQQRKQRIDALSRLVDVLNPVATLRRGYTITRIDGHALKSAADATSGAVMETYFPDGTIKSEVK